MNQKDYEELGAAHARAGEVRRYSRTSDTWQAKAYHRGVDSVEKTIVLMGGRGHGKSFANSMIRAAGAAQGLKDVFSKPLEVNKVWVDDGKHLLLSSIKLDAEKMAGASAHLPQAAREHIKLLVHQHNNERHAMRRERLHRSIKRVILRWTGTQL